VSLVERIEAGADAAGAHAAGAGRVWVVEVVREGYLLHYGEPRAFGEIDDDLKLLGGDALYARGLSRLAAEGDLEAVAVLADLISDCAQAESEGRPTEELWAAAEDRLARPNPAE
jgi:hypothetical protein